MKDLVFKLLFNSSGEKTMVELILLLLTGEWSLSPKGISERLTQKFSHKISFQEIRKVVKWIFPRNKKSVMARTRLDSKERHKQRVC